MTRREKDTRAILDNKRKPSVLTREREHKSSLCQQEKETQEQHLIIIRLSTVKMVFGRIYGQCQVKTRLQLDLRVAYLSACLISVNDSKDG